MPKPRSGWLTILPAGKWYLQDTRLPAYIGSRRTISAQVGAFGQKKRIRIGLPPLHPGRIRTRIRWKVRNDQLILGPVLGILTVGEGMEFRGNRENFRDIFLSGKRLGALVYVFTPGGIQWSDKKIRGFVYDEKQGTWVEMMLPFPHVVYNRIPTRKWEKRSEVRKTLKRLGNLPNLTLFNRSFFNKYMLFHMLRDTPDISSFLPDTKKLDSLASLKSFCSRYPFVYLKPVLGKAGQGIMRIDRWQNRWRLRRVHQQRAITRQFATLEGLWRHIRKKVLKKQYIIQQGIPLCKYRGRPFDVRVLVQKDGVGEWIVTGFGIRRAGANSITTHVPRGGSILSPHVVLHKLFGDFADQVTERIHQTALKFAKTLERKFVDLAEMSMDMGLTRDGRLWFFEANAKPEKFDEPRIRRSSLANLIEYAQYLAQVRENSQESAVG